MALPHPKGGALRQDESFLREARTCSVPGSRRRQLELDAVDVDEQGGGGHVEQGCLICLTNCQGSVRANGQRSYGGAGCSLLEQMKRRHHVKHQQAGACWRA